MVMSMANTKCKKISDKFSMLIASIHSFSVCLSKHLKMAHNFSHNELGSSTSDSCDTGGDKCIKLQYLLGQISKELDN